LIRKGGHWVTQSDNRDFDDIVIDDGELVTIIDRVIWMGVKL
jgi:phage repressor protein C with HTH and peptisase S24 domain